MIDVHFHCLPGIDDGPGDWDDAVSLCRAAASEGTTTIVATPHVLREPWINEEPRKRDELIARLNSLLGGSPAVLAGCEYFFSSDAVELWERGSTGPLTGLNRSSFLLVEFPEDVDSRSAEAMFHEFSILGVTPVVAHPERSPLFALETERLGRLVELGARVQLTAGAITGDFGSRAAAACKKFFELGLVHLVASDAHSLSARPPRLAAARKIVRRKWGREAEEGIFEANPLALIENRPLPWAGA
ncbi:MAG: tyrosine-protein phosphatase [Thermoanaerobaculia bacterium]